MQEYDIEIVDRFICNTRIHFYVAMNFVAHPLLILKLLQIKALYEQCSIRNSQAFKSPRIDNDAIHKFVGDMVSIFVYDICILR